MSQVPNKGGPWSWTHNLNARKHKDMRTGNMKGLIYTALMMAIIAAGTIVEARKHSGLQHSGLDKPPISFRSKSLSRRYKAKQMRTLASMRGGATAKDDDGDDDDLPLTMLNTSLEITDFVVMCSSMAAVIGAILGFTPEIGADILGYETFTNDVTAFLVGALGFIIFGTSLTVFLVTTERTSVERAIGIGLLSRLYYVIHELFISQKKRKIGMKKTFITPILIIGSFSSISMIIGANHATFAGKFVAIMSSIAGLALYANPVKIAELQFGLIVDEYGEEMNRGLCKMLGEQVLLSGVYMGTLLYGANPIHAIGYASLLWSILLVDYLFFSKTYELVGMHPARYMVFLAIASSFAYSCLIAPGIVYE